MNCHVSVVDAVSKLEQILVLCILFQYSLISPLKLINKSGIDMHEYYIGAQSWGGTTQMEGPLFSATLLHSSVNRCREIQINSQQRRASIREFTDEITSVMFTICYTVRCNIKYNFRFNENLILAQWLWAVDRNCISNWIPIIAINVTDLASNPDSMRSHTEIDAECNRRKQFGGVLKKYRGRDW